MTTQLPHAMEIVETLPSDIQVIWGGIHATLDPLSLLNYYPDHIVVVGEGETALPLIANYLESNRSLDELAGKYGICKNVSGENIIADAYFHQDINVLADLDYIRDLPNLESYLDYYDPLFQRQGKWFKIIVARGCHWQCSFCINAVLRKKGSHYRTKSIEKIRREIEPVLDRFPEISFVEPRDEDFFIDRTLLRGWLDFVKERDLIWTANCRFNYFDSFMTKDLLEECVENKLYCIGMSVEAGDETIRNKILNKKISNKQIEKAEEIITSTVGKRMFVGTSFITDFPGDTLENKIATLKMMNKMSLRLNIVFSGPQIYRSYPGSDLYFLETERKIGDLSYYIDSIGFDGTEKSRKKNYNNIFFSDVLMTYFNSRLLTLEYKNDRTYDVSSRHLYKVPLWLNIVFIPIRFRLKFDFWHCFYESAIIGWLWKNKDRWIVCWPDLIVGNFMRLLSMVFHLFPYNTRGWIKSHILGR
jgi:radical SAM superfamily enzyme YgiQ (UPF0313 family)